MIANPRVNHHLAWWSYPLLLAGLVALPCLPSLSAQGSNSEPAAKTADIDLLAPIFFDEIYVDQSGFMRASSQMLI